MPKDFRSLQDRLRQQDMTLGEKLRQISWTYILLISIVATAGFFMLYSAANGQWEPWASRQIARFGIGLLAMLALALINIRVYLRYAYVFYAVSLVLLVAVDVKGVIGMGAQRWIDFGVIRLQPSELMKIALVLSLARYFHGLSIEDIGRPVSLIVPLFMTLAPVGLILKQPDLGTALMLMMGSGIVFFAAGVRLWKFALVIAGGLAAIPVGWGMLHDYQRNRVLTFINPERDPLGAGYHILQSKIALGSGGIFGRGFMQGTQSHLNFLPEKQTDFIFTMLAEEFGMVGGLALLSLYTLIVVFGLVIALRCRHHFGRLLALGLTANFFLYVFINIAMVMGLIPVVGVPLPLISYGGTVMLTLMC
ncbi:MAG: rod shape-determining protein RodA, partial [Rhodospirillaceae bacterium]